MNWLVLAVFLFGYVSNLDGRVGVRVSHGSNTINHVYRYSPATEIGLEVGDIILSSDGHKGTSHMTGPCGSIILIKIKRGKEVYNYYTERRSWKEVSD